MHRATSSFGFDQGVTRDVHLGESSHGLLLFGQIRPIMRAFAPLAPPCYHRGVPCGGISSVGRAPDCGSGSRGFKSHIPPPPYSMTIDERLEKLIERDEGLTQTVELMAAEGRETSLRISALERLAQIGRASLLVNSGIL